MALVMTNEQIMRTGCDGNESELKMTLDSSPTAIADSHLAVAVGDN